MDKLCEGGLLKRRHGRVELSPRQSNTPFDQRLSTNLAEKRNIGEAAAELIPDGATVFISIGSTPLSVARALRRRKGLTVITNNLSAALALSDEMTNRIILPGGELRLPDRDILGEDVLAFFSRYRAEFCIFGVAGIAEDGSLLEFHAAEVRAREQIMANSQRSILVIDHSKFGRLALALRLERASRQERMYRVCASIMITIELCPRFVLGPYIMKKFGNPLCVIPR